MYRKEPNVYSGLFWGGTQLLKVKYVTLSERLLANVQFGIIIEIRLSQYKHVISAWTRDYPLQIITYLDY